MPSKRSAQQGRQSARPLLIGLTGLIGAGKSTVAAMLAVRGAAIIDADQIGRDVVDQSPALRRQLATAFGRQVLNRNGTLNRTALAKEAFLNRQRKKRLDALVHPALLRKLWDQVRIAGLRSPVVVIDAALLLNWGMEQQCDLVVVVHARQPVRLQRMLKRGLTVTDFRARQRAQVRYGELLEASDFLIHNSVSDAALRARVERFWRRFVAPAIDRPAATS